MNRLLLLVETIVLFALGVAGNKVAEHLSVSPTVVVGASAALLVGAVLLAWRSTPSTAAPLVTSQPALTFLSAGLVTGLIAGAFVAALVEPKLTPLRFPLIRDWETQAYAFDIVGAFGGILLCLVVALGWSSPRALAASIGYALALSTAILVVQPKITGAFGTYTGHLATALLAWCVIAPLSKYLRKP